MIIDLRITNREKTDQEDITPITPDKPSLPAPDIAQKIEVALTEYASRNQNNNDAIVFIEDLSKQFSYPVDCLSAWYQNKRDENNNTRDKKLTDRLLALIDKQQCEFFHDAAGEAYVIIPGDEQC